MVLLSVMFFLTSVWLQLVPEEKNKTKNNP